MLLISNKQKIKKQKFCRVNEAKFFTMIMENVKEARKTLKQMKFWLFSFAIFREENTLESLIQHIRFWDLTLM